MMEVARELQTALSIDQQTWLIVDRRQTELRAYKRFGAFLAESFQ